MIVRAFAAGDAEAVRALLRSAFASASESDLVERLRSDGDAAIELVAEHDAMIVGYILFSPLDAPVRSLALAPLAVAPDRQRQGVGSALVRAGHQLARSAGFDAIFVLGDPDYYGRFGYRAAAAAGFDSPYAGPHFMALALGAPIAETGGPVRYARAFAALG